VRTTFTDSGELLVQYDAVPLATRYRGRMLTVGPAE
jgi:hypothetical protein